MGRLHWVRMGLAMGVVLVGSAVQAAPPGQEPEPAVKEPATPMEAVAPAPAQRRWLNPMARAYLPIGLQSVLDGQPSEVPTPEPRRWGRDILSPYYPLHGLQSPLRNDGIHVGGDIWIDAGYEKHLRPLESEPDIQIWITKGRFMLDITATKTFKRFFIQAKGQFLASIEQIPGVPTISVDDAWVRFGMWDLWDIQVGRYEGWEIYAKGEGLERDTLEDLGAYGGPDIYEVNYAFYRQNGFGSAALHVYPLKWLRFEVGAVFGNALGFNSIGVRPVAILDFEWVKFKFGGEYRKLSHQESGRKEWEVRRGLGGGLHFFFDDPHKILRFQFGINAAYGLVDRVDAFDKVDERGSPDTLSAGGFFNLGFWSAVLGLGYNHTLQDDRQFNNETGRVGHFTHKQLFVSFRHPIVIDNLMAKVVFSWAQADLQPAFDNKRTNDMYSVRLRLSMVF